MDALIQFLERHLFHSVLLDSMEKEGLTALLSTAKDELGKLEARVAALETHQPTTTTSTAVDSSSSTGEPAA